jgi:hypothetical protein
MSNWSTADEDYLGTYFMTKSEGPASFHFSVLRNGHVFVVRPFHPDGSLFNLADLKRSFMAVKSMADALGPGEGVAALTADHRDKWAANRDILRRICETVLLKLFA